MPSAIPQPGTDHVAGERVTGRHVGLVAMLAVVVMFEGFDISATSVVLPYLGQEFGAEPAALGQALGIIALGSIAAWFLVRLSDKVGRRPILLLATAGFALGSLATVLSWSVGSYTAIQLVTRLLLVTQIATAYLIVSETLPPAVRGRANGILGACGSIGAALPFIALAPALASPFGWRLIFVIGALPILILPLLFWKLRETPVWLEVQKRGAPRLSARSEIGLLLSPALRSRFAAMSGLWFIINFASAASAAFFTLYVVQERSWSPADIARLAPVGLAGSFLGFLAAGAAMDLIGRRWTVTILMIALGLLTQLCYYSHSWWAITVGFVGLQASLGIWVVAYTLNAELFPTELRAAANGWCHNLIGRWGVVLAPLLLGGLAKGMGGIGPAAIALSFVAFLAVPLVWLALPETRGRPLGRS